MSGRRVPWPLGAAQRGRQARRHGAAQSPCRWVRRRGAHASLLESHGNATAPATSQVLCLVGFALVSPPPHTTFGGCLSTRRPARPHLRRARQAFSEHYSVNILVVLEAAGTFIEFTAPRGQPMGWLAILFSGPQVRARPAGGTPDW